MDDFTAKIVKTLSEGKTLTEVFRHHVEQAVNRLLQIELTEHLDYEPYDRQGFHSGNSRNGFYPRTLKTEYGELHLKIPRDRNGEFKAQTVAPYKRQNDTLESTIIHLYSRGLTTREITQMIETMYGHHYSPTSISNITAAVMEDLDAFHKRSLASRYAVIYLDATFLPVRRDTVSKEALYFALGITPEGVKEVLTYRLFPTESAHNWRLIIEELKERGVEQSLLFVTDGLSGLREAILEVYPSARHQTCWVHLARNVSHAVRVKDRQDVLEDLKSLYRAHTLEEANANREAFMAKWSKRYPKVTQKLEDTTSLWSYLAFPKAIQASLYTTNIVENFNKHLKRYVKRKEQFPNEEALARFILNQVDQYNHRFALRVHRGFGKCAHELNEMFD